MSDWSSLGIAPAVFLLPRQRDLNRFWPVVACDQYTSQPEVWRAVEEEIGQHPSTLRLIIPEAFLEETEAISQRAEQAMRDYLQEGLLTEVPEGFILVERSTQSGKRIGLVTVIDLEQYDYREGSRSLIRATEQTVLERIPPRLKLRERAALELSHVLLLVDDREDLLIGPLYERREALSLVYDLPLLMQGGHIRGWQITGEAEFHHLTETLKSLKARLAPEAPLFAVGDGNHSLAAAKANWDQHKERLSPAEQARHPARFAMVELINLHSPKLLFEPIHRAVFGADAQAVQRALAPLRPMPDKTSPDITLITREGDLPLRLPGAEGRMVTAAVQELLDQAGFTLDYVHGTEALQSLVDNGNTVGILMPDFPKDQLFPTVQRDGRLPRKTFSMGEANEKRFYLEARKII